MKHKVTLAMSTLLVGLIAAGCASTSAPPDASTSHPANAQGAASPLPPFPPSLLAVTNLVMVKPVTGPAPEHQHGHGAHDTKPKTEEKP